MAAPTILWGADTAQASGTTRTPVLPTHQSDDILLAIAHAGQSSTITCGTAGWSLLGTVETSANQSTAVFWKRATSAAETNPTITWGTAGSATNVISALAGRVRGVPATMSTPWESLTQTSTALGTSVVGSSITTANNDSLMVHIAEVDANVSYSGYQPATWTDDQQVASAVGSGYVFLCISKAQATPSTVASPTIATLGTTNYKRVTSLAFPSIAPTTTTSLQGTIAGTSTYSAVPREGIKGALSGTGTLSGTTFPNQVQGVMEGTGTLSAPTLSEILPDLHAVPLAGVGVFQATLVDVPDPLAGDFGGGSTFSGSLAFVGSPPSPPNAGITNPRVRFRKRSGRRWF